LSLKKFDYFTREQLQKIHNLKGDRNANRVLSGLSKYLGSFRHGMENVYYLNKAGREHVGCKVVRKKTPNIQHFLMRNQLWICMGMPHSWENEIKVTVKDINIICDAKFLLQKTDILVEIDITQSMAKNRGKIDKYKRIKELTGNDFHLIWVTETESRRAALTNLMAAAKLTGKVYSIKDLRF
jgi:hypothetical protein